MKTKIKLDIYREKGDKKDKYNLKIGKYKSSRTIAKPLAMLAQQQENYRKIFIVQMNMFLVLEYKSMKKNFPMTYGNMTLKEFASDYFNGQIDYYKNINFK